MPVTAALRPALASKPDKQLLSRSYAQLGAGYGASNVASATVARAHAETKTFVNAHGVGEVVLGPSTSQLLDNLGNCYSRVLGPGDEVIALTLSWPCHRITCS